MIYTPKTKAAMRLCFAAHRDQTDKGGLPYVFHPFHLAEQMEDEDTVAAALLHDVVEDTGITLDELASMGFGKPVMDALALLTHDPSVPYLEYITRIRSNPIARAVKLADLQHNSDVSRLDGAPTDQDNRRLLKYRMAQAVLADDPFDRFVGAYRKQIPLDLERLCFLSVFYDRDGGIRKYSYDIEAASDEHYEFSPAAANQFRALLPFPGTLPEAIAAYHLATRTPFRLTTLIEQSGIPYKSYHF